MSIGNIITHGYYKYYDDTDVEEFVWHREDGPALIFENGIKIWFFHGQDVTNEVEKWLHERNIENYKEMTEEDKLALTFFMRSL